MAYLVTDNEYKDFDVQIGLLKEILKLREQ